MRNESRSEKIILSVMSVDVTSPPMRLCVLFFVSQRERN